MSQSVSAIPTGYRTVTPYLIVRGARAAIDFYQRAFGATETLCLQGPDGLIGHAEVQIGNSIVMLAEENPAWCAQGPHTLGGTPVSLLVYVEDVDAVFQRAIEAGAKEVRGVQDQFYGDRSGTVDDPFGHRWSIATHIEDVPQAEVERRFRQMTEGQ